MFFWGLKGILVFFNRLLIDLNKHCGKKTKSKENGVRYIIEIYSMMIIETMPFVKVLISKITSD